jgi:hypothetical protein
MSSATTGTPDGPSKHRSPTPPSTHGPLESPDDVAFHVEPPAGDATADNDVWIWVTPSGFKYVEQRPNGDVTDVREPGDIHPDITEYEFLARLTTQQFCDSLSRVSRRRIPGQH